MSIPGQFSASSFGRATNVRSFGSIKEVYMLESVDSHINGDAKMALGASKLAFRWLAVVLISVLVFSAPYTLVQALDY
jgi:hypothetical protein